MFVIHFLLDSDDNNENAISCYDSMFMYRRHYVSDCHCDKLEQQAT